MQFTKIYVYSNLYNNLSILWSGLFTNYLYIESSIQYIVQHLFIYDLHVLNFK